MCILEGVTHRKIHAVAVIAGEYQRAIVEHTHEARITAFVGAVWPPGGIRGREEKHVHALDEGAVIDRHLRADQALLNPVGQSFGIKLFLQPPLAIGVKRWHGLPPGATAVSFAWRNCWPRTSRSRRLAHRRRPRHHGLWARK